MAGSSGNYNEDEFSDMEPVLDEDSFSFDSLDEEESPTTNTDDFLSPGMNPPDLDDFGLDSMIESVGDDYPEEKLDSTDFDLDLDSDLSLVDDTDLPTEGELLLETDPLLEMDSLESSDDNTPSLPSSNTDSFSDSDFDLNLDIDLELDLEEDDPGIDKKIEEIVNETSPKLPPTETIATDEEEFNFDSLDGEEDDTITLSLDELDNITSELPESSEEDDILGEDLSDEPIALSMDELENIMAEEESESTDSLNFDLDSPDDTVSDDLDFDSLEDKKEEESITEDELLPIQDSETENLFDGDDIADEPITLSMDELSNITAFDDTPPSNLFMDDELEDSSFEVEMEDPLEEVSHEVEMEDPLEEVSHEMEIEDPLEDESEPEDRDSSEKSLPESDLDFDLDDSLEESSFEEADEDEPITLSMDELSAITGDAEEDFISTASEPSEDFSGLPEPDETVDFEEFTLGDSDITSEDTNHLSETKEEDENLTLSDEELGNILGAESELPEDLYDANDEISLLPEDEEDEAIALSSDELSDIIGELPPGEDLDEMGQVVEEEATLPKSPSLDPSLISDDEEVIDLDEYAEEGALSPLEEMRSSPTEKEVTAKSEDPIQKTEDPGSELSPEEKKKVLSYLDNLLGNLPDDMIREFSKSNYFDLYKKMMKEIGL
jgi:hypothetical protein